MRDMHYFMCTHTVPNYHLNAHTVYGHTSLDAQTLLLAGSLLVGRKRGEGEGEGRGERKNANTKQSEWE